MSSRALTLCVLLGVVAAGLAARASLPPPVAGPAGDVLYATLVVLLVAVVRPRTRPLTAAAVGFVVCVAVELLQLTGIPAALAERVPTVRLVLGTTFWAPDLLLYAVGAVVGGALCVAVARGGRGRRQ